MPYVVVMLDAQDPVCNAPGTNRNWFADMYHNEMPNPTNNPADEWTVTNLGEVFGVAVDQDPIAPNIYVTSTRVYGNSVGTGNVYRLDGVTGAITLIATLPNSGQGLGQIAYDADHDQLWVSNFEDGRIYRLQTDGTVIDAYDPFAPDDGTPGFAPLGERVFGLNVYDCRLYFGVWSEDARAAQGLPVFGPNTVWSVELAADGSVTGAPLLEVTLPDFSAGNPYSTPVSDISFSRTGNMMLAERGMFGDTSNAPHQAEILEYTGGSGAWVPSGSSFSVGAITIAKPGANSAGGVDYDCAEADNCNAGGHVYATGDALVFGTDNFSYGVQILPDTGGSTADSYMIDFDGDIVSQDKTGIGDIDVFRTCLPRTQCRVTDPGCTYTQGYWKNHNRYRTNNNGSLPWPIDEDTLLCGMTWLDILNTPPQGDAWYILAHQWIAASLNVAGGASTTPDVDAALSNGQALLESCLRDGGDRPGALAAAVALDDYNNGVIGPGHCDDADGGEPDPPSAPTDSSVSGTRGSGTSASAATAPTAMTDTRSTGSGTSTMSRTQRAGERGERGGAGCALAASEPGFGLAALSLLGGALVRRRRGL